MSRTTLVELPFAYAARFMPPGRKQAVVRICIERHPVQVTAPGLEEAPLAGRMERLCRTSRYDDSHGPMRGVDYRIAEGTDGVVRLMAPVASWAFPGSSAFPASDGWWESENVHVRERVSEMADLRPDFMAMRGMLDPGLAWLGDVVRSWRVDRETFHDGIVSSGLISSGRDEALDRLQSAARRIAVVDGILHSAVPPPVEGVLRSERKAGIVPEWYAAAFLDDPEDSHPVLPALGSTSPTPLASLDVFVPEAFVTDASWRAFVRATTQGTSTASVSERIVIKMLPNEIAWLHAIRERLHPARLSDRRDQGLVSEAVRVMRVLHSVAPGTFRQHQIRMEKAIDAMARSVEPGMLGPRIVQNASAPGL